MHVYVCFDTSIHLYNREHTKRRLKVKEDKQKQDRKGGRLSKGNPNTSFTSKRSYKALI